jgi:hypothetical protein
MVLYNLSETMNPMQSHVKILGILHIVFGALGLLIGIGMLVLFGGIAGIVGMNAESEDAAIAVPILGGIGGLIFVFTALLSIPGIIAGIGLLHLRPWARILAIIISILSLLHVPFGTALGFYGIWVLFSRDGQALFERQAYVK